MGKGHSTEGRYLKIIVRAYLLVIKDSSMVMKQLYFPQNIDKASEFWAKRIFAFLFFFHLLDSASLRRRNFKPFLMPVSWRTPFGYHPTPNNFTGNMKLLLNTQLRCLTTRNITDFVIKIRKKVGSWQ